MFTKSCWNSGKSSAFTVFKRLENNKQLLINTSKLFMRTFTRRFNLNCLDYYMIIMLHLNLVIKLHSINFIFKILEMQM